MAFDCNDAGVCDLSVIKYGRSGAYVAALIELCLCSRVKGGAEGIYPEEAVTLDRALVLTEKGENESLLGLQNLKAGQGNPACEEEQDCYDKQSRGSLFGAEYRAEDDKTNSGKHSEYGENENEHTVLFVS